MNSHGSNPQDINTGYIIQCFAFVVFYFCGDFTAFIHKSNIELQIIILVK